MREGEGRDPSAGNQCEEENSKREKRHDYDFVSPLREKFRMEENPKVRDESACAMEKGLGFGTLHPYMWHRSEAARITAINGVVLSKLMTVSEHCTGQPPIQKVLVGKPTASVVCEMRG